MPQRLPLKQLALVVRCQRCHVPVVAAVRHRRGAFLWLDAMPDEAGSFLLTPEPGAPLATKLGPGDHLFIRPGIGSRHHEHNCATEHPT